jgi:hypothetical protein
MTDRSSQTLLASASTLRESRTHVVRATQRHPLHSTYRMPFKIKVCQKASVD